MRFTFATLVLFVAPALGCEPALPDYPPEQDCDFDSGVCKAGGAGAGVGNGAGGATTTGGTGATTTTTGTGASTTTSTLTGSIGLVTSECFGAPTTTFNGTVNLVVTPSGGSPITVPYGASGGTGGTSASTSFDVPNVHGSSAWVLVDDTTMGGSGILSTLSYLALPQVGPVEIPAIDDGMFTSLATSQPDLAQTGINTSAAQLVLQIAHGGAPFAGLSLTGGVAGTVAYDMGGCTYDDTATATGPDGTIIVFNAGGSGPVTITLTNASATPPATYTVPVLTVAGAVTYVAVSL
jgi:hypothetical protein